MLLKPRIIVDDKIAYTRIPYLGKWPCSECKYHLRNGRVENDCRCVKLKRGIRLASYCENSIIYDLRCNSKFWNYVIIEKENKTN